MGSFSGRSERFERNSFRLVIGAVPSPFDCYLVNRGLKTLSVRMEKHMQNGLAIAKFLESHPLVQKLIYPGLPSHPQHDLASRQCSGFSGVVTFFIKGDLKETEEFVKHFKLFTLAVSLGDVESLVEIPSIMTHASLSKKEKDLLGITDNLVRLSVGIESTKDLIEDIDQALKRSCKKLSKV